MMKEWRDVLEVVAFAAQIVSFPIAALSIVLGRKEASASRDLHVALSLSESFRKYWESGWGEDLEEIAESQKIQPEARLSAAHEKKIRFMLNWIDWLGTFINTKSFHNPNIVLDSVGGRLRQIINAGRGVMEADIASHGVEYWKGTLTVSKLLRIGWTGTYVSTLG